MTTYYQQIEDYYDGDANDFDRRYWNNFTLQLIRQDFREQVKRFHFTQMLEIGYGTGLDMIHFGKTHPDVKVSGIDISGRMQQITEEKILNADLENVSARKGSVEDLLQLFPEARFDMVYVFFGALNTVADLSRAADVLYKASAPGGTLVLTFVNKYYLAGMLIELLKLRPKSAFSRLKKVWGGYSPSENLSSHCYSPAEIRESFAQFKLLSYKGYSIIHPAWYYHRLNKIFRRLSPWLWRADQHINKTTFWSLGEYTLFAFQKPDNINQ